MAGFSFKKQNGTDNATNLTEAKVVVYEDTSGNKYIFGVDGGNHDEFKTFQYEPSSGAGAGTAVDYSALAKEFMSLGGVKALLGRLAAIETINTNVGTIETAVGNSSGSLGAALGALDTKVDEVKAKTDKLDLANANAQGTLGEALGKLAKADQLSALDGKVGLVKDKTDNMPANLITELAPLTAAAGKITAIETAVGSSPLADRFTGLAQQATLTALGSEVDAIKTQTNPIPTDLQTRLEALDPTVTTKGLGQVLKGIQDKTDKLDLANANAQGTLGEALGKLAKADQLSALDGKVGLVKDKTDNMPDNLKTELAPLTAAAGKITAIETVVGSSPLAPMLTGLAQQTTLTTLDGKVGLVKDKTDLIPTNFQTRLNALDPAVTSGGLGQALKGIQDKTEKLDLTVATGTLGKALSELAKTTELAPLATVAGKVATIEGKASLIPDNLLARLDALDLTDATAKGTLGEALDKLAKAQKLLDRNIIADAEADLDSSEHLFSSAEPPQSNSAYTSNEDIWGIK